MVITKLYPMNTIKNIFGDEEVLGVPVKSPMFLATLKLEALRAEEAGGITNENRRREVIYQILNIEKSYSRLQMLKMNDIINHRML